MVFSMIVTPFLQVGFILPYTIIFQTTFENSELEGELLNFKVKFTTNFGISEQSLENNHVNFKVIIE